MASSTLHPTSPFFKTSETELTTNGLTAVACNFRNGGFVKIGKFVIVELRITVTSDVTAWDSIVTGFPTTGGPEIPLVAYDTEGKYHALDISYDKLRRYPNDNTILNKTINIFGCYLTP